MSNTEMVSNFWTFISKRLDAEAPLADWRLMVGNGLDFDQLQRQYLVSTGKSANLITCPKPCSPACGFRKVCEYEGEYEAVCREWPLKSYPIDAVDAQIFTVNTAAIVPELVRIFQIKSRPSAFNNETDTWQLGEVILPGGKSATVYFTLKIWDHEVTDLVYRINCKENRPYILLVTARKVIHPTSDAILKNMSAVFVPLNEVTDFSEDAELRLIQECNLAYLIAPPVAYPEPEPDNIFRKCGDAWEIRFAGGDKFMLTTGHTGATYLHFMLARPNVATPVLEIMKSVSGETDVYVPSNRIDKDDFNAGFSFRDTPVLESDNIADETALRQYLDEARLLSAELEDARAAGDNITTAQLEDELARLRAVIYEAVAPDGQRKRLVDQIKRLSDAFRRPTVFAIDKIGCYDELLATHLRNAIKYGQTPGYFPTCDVPWTL